MTSRERLNNAQRMNNSLLCVGLDSDPAKMPEGFSGSPKSILDFNKRIIDATKDIVCGYKLNFAFYEQHGPKGFDILEKTFAYIPYNLFTIADAKRGDIGNTSKAYARSVFEHFRADSITVAPYMGRDSIEPFLEYTDKITFLLALTSNKGSSDFQRINIKKKPLYRYVFEETVKWKYDNLGYVVGATHPKEINELRKFGEDKIFLIPGIGAQGGDLKAIIKANLGLPAIINVSRSVIHASNGTDFQEKARDAAIFYRDAINDESVMFIREHKHKRENDQL